MYVVGCIIVYILQGYMQQTAGEKIYACKNSKDVSSKHYFIEDSKTRGQTDEAAHHKPNPAGTRCRNDVDAAS